MQAAASLTQQLRAYSAGDRNMAEAILLEVFPKLHQIAASHLQNERYCAPVSPTELINDVWVRHLHKGGWSIESRQHFYSIAGQAMRRVLVDYARSRLALKRGGFDEPLSLDVAAYAEPVDTERAEQVVEIGLLMEKLALAHPKSARIVDLHYFAGFSLEEIAQITGLSPRQIRHLWTKGRDWLRDRMTEPADRARSAP